MHLPVTYLGTGRGALDLMPVRGRKRIEAAQVIVADEAERLAAWAPQATRIEARPLDAAAIVARLRDAHRAGQSAVRAVAGGLAESMRALDEIRLLLEAEVTLELVGAAPGDDVRWPWRDRLPLAGKTIAVTRPRAADDPLSDLLARMGAQVLDAPALALGPLPDPGAVDRGIEGLHRYACAVFTSANGVAAFFDRLALKGKDARWLTGLKLAVVGPGTGCALRAHGLTADLAPAEYRGEALAQAIADAVSPGERVLIVRAVHGREALPTALARAGLLVDVVAAYQMIAPPKESFAALEDALGKGQVHAVTLTSTAAAKNVVAALGTHALANAPLACLGPVTADGVRDLGLHPTWVAPSSRFEDLVAVLAQALGPARDDR